MFNICRSIISLSDASNVAQSPIQPKRQDSKKNSGEDFRGDRKEGFGQNLEKKGVGKIGGSS